MEAVAIAIFAVLTSLGAGILAVLSLISLGAMKARMDVMSASIRRVEESLAEKRGTMSADLSATPHGAIASPVGKSSVDDFVREVTGRSPAPGPAALPPLAAPVSSADAGTPGGTPPTQSPATLQPAQRTPVTASVPSQERTSPDAAEVWGRLEQMVGKQWMTWGGVLALFLSAAFFFKYAIEQGWIGPRVRVSIGCAFGAILFGLGCRFMVRKMRSLGQGLAGGGLAVLYLSLYAGHEMYGLFGTTLTFALLVGVSAVGMILAVMANALPISFLAVLGGFLTPILVSTGEDMRDVLFSYVLLLDLTVLGLSLFRKWRSIDVLAFFGTGCLFVLWFGRFYRPEAMGPTLAWLGGFYVLFLVQPMLGHLRRCTHVHAEHLAIFLFNSVGTFFIAADILDPPRSDVLAGIAFGMCLAGLALAVAARRRIPEDLRTLFCLTAVSMALLTVSIPIGFDKEAIALLWGAEVALLAYAGRRFHYAPARVGGFLVLALLFVRILIAHVGEQTTAFTLFLNTDFGAALAGPAAAGLFVVICVGRVKKLPAWRWALATLAGIGGGLMLLLLLQVEAAQWFQHTLGIEREVGVVSGVETHLSSAVPLARVDRFHAFCFGCVLWAGGAIGFMQVGRVLRNNALRLASVLPMFAAMGCLGALYGICEYKAPLLGLNLRFLCALVAAACPFILAAQRRLGEEEGEQQRQEVRGLACVSIVALLIVLSAEAFLFTRNLTADAARAQWLSQMALTITWSLYAIALLTVGIIRRIRPIRFAALGLFGVTLLKLLFNDIAEIKELYRIGAFVAAGTLLIIGSWLYHRLEKALAAGQAAEAADDIRIDRPG